MSTFPPSLTRVIFLNVFTERDARAISLYLWRDSRGGSRHPADATRFPGVSVTCRSPRSDRSPTVMTSGTEARRLKLIRPQKQKQKQKRAEGGGGQGGGGRDHGGFQIRTIECTPRNR